MRPRQRHQVICRLSPPVDAARIRRSAEKVKPQPARRAVRRAQASRRIVRPDCRYALYASWPRLRGARHPPSYATTFQALSRRARLRCPNARHHKPDVTMIASVHTQVATGSLICSSRRIAQF